MTSKSFQRIQKVWPAGIARPAIVLDLAVRLAAELPSTAPTVVVNGVWKSSASTSVQVPVVRSVALTLYWKSIRSARLAAPSRHSSPVYATSSDVIVAPVLFVNAAPKVGLSVPLSSPPSARSVEPVAPKLYVLPPVPEPVPTA